MQSPYIYAGTRAKTLEHELLTDVQREVLLGARSMDEFFAGLQDTFIAPYLVREGTRDLSRALEDAVYDAKHLLDQIAPEPELLNILWIKYDFYNLKAIIKGGLADLSDEEIKGHCFRTSIYDADRLLKAYQSDRLDVVDPRLARGAKEARGYKRIADIDLVLNLHYLTSARDMAREAGNLFVTNYITLLIDLFNLKAALRTKAFSHEQVKDMFVDGGTFHRRELEGETTDDILNQFQRVGGPGVWSAGIDEYRETGSFSLIEKTSEDYVSSWLKGQSYEIFSPAPLFAYFTAKKNNVQQIRAIHVSKAAGIPEHDIRATLRNLYSSL
ncbi:MAG: V-type ATPase subunit [Candidatus Paceibacterota bacterium]